MATKEWFPLDSKGIPMKTEIMEVESEEEIVYSIHCLMHHQ